MGTWFRNLNNNSENALVVNWRFHKKNKWVSAFSRYLVEAIIHHFEPIIISSQAEYNFFKKRIKFLISMEPGWAAPKLKYDTNISCKKAVFYSDPHYQTTTRFEYLIKNDFNYVLSFYREPFFYHFKNFPRERFIHFPWAVPDQFVNKNKITNGSKGEIVIFGGKGSDAYDMRNWCRVQDHVTNYNFSGVENKQLSDEQYYLWLQQFEAIVAAGSTDPKYDLVTPKYFEILGSGALLIGQYCKDYEHLGINSDNSIVFRNKEEFINAIGRYKENPGSFTRKRNNGRDLIINNHLISHRINLIKELFNADK